MKKVFAILLVALLIAGAVFASGNTVTVKSVVGSVPINKANENAIAASKSLYQLFVADGQTLSNTTTSNADISVNDVEASFTVKQNALVRTSEFINLTITAGQLSFTDATNTYSTDALSITDYAAATTLVNVGFTPATNALAMKVTYKGVSQEFEVPADTAIATFKTTWTKKAALADHPGTYSADITLAYTVE